MRVCVIGPAAPLRGGVAKHTAGLAAALDGRGHEVRVISFRRLYPACLFPGRSMRDATPALGEPLLDALDPRTWIETRRLVGGWRPDLIVAQWWHPCIAPALAAVLAGARVPTALICHNARPHEWFPFSRGAARAVFAAADLAVCHSRFVAAELRRCAPALACEVAPMPLLIEGGGAPFERRRGGAVALCAGLLRPYKGVELLLEAWSRSVLPHDARLLIAGESYLGRRAARRLAGRVRDGMNVDWCERWLSDRELWELMLGADVFVLPHLRASQSGLLPIALRSGLRVIATDAGGLSEDLPDARHQIVKAGDSAALARALEHAIADVDAARQWRHEACVPASDSWAATAAACERLATRGGGKSQARRGGAAQV